MTNEQYAQLIQIIIKHGESIARIEAKLDNGLISDFRELAKKVEGGNGWKKYMPFVVLAIVALLSGQVDKLPQLFSLLGL